MITAAAGLVAAVAGVIPVLANRGDDGGKGASTAAASLVPLATTPAEVDPRTISPSASSVHPSDRGITYSARNTLDDNPFSAWNADGDGVGEWLNYEFARPMKLTAITLVNGYAKDPATWTRNNRLRRVEFITDARSFARTLRDTRETQRVVGPFGRTRSVRIEVRSVYTGSDPTIRDAALTEIAFVAR